MIKLFISLVFVFSVYAMQAQNWINLYKTGNYNRLTYEYCLQNKDSVSEIYIDFRKDSYDWRKDHFFKVESINSSFKIVSINDFIKNFKNVTIIGFRYKLIPIDFSVFTNLKSLHFKADYDYVNKKYEYVPIPKSLAKTSIREVSFGDRGRYHIWFSNDQIESFKNQSFSEIFQNQNITNIKRTVTDWSERSVSNFSIKYKIDTLKIRTWVKLATLKLDSTITSNPQFSYIEINLDSLSLSQVEKFILSPNPKHLLLKFGNASKIDSTEIVRFKTKMLLKNITVDIVEKFKY